MSPEHPEKMWGNESIYTAKKIISSRFNSSFSVESIIDYFPSYTNYLDFLMVPIV